MQSVFIIHGIRTKATRRIWIQMLRIWLYIKYGMALYIITEKYKAGPFSVRNHLSVNPYQAASLFEECEIALEMFGEGVGLNFVSHSNGTNVTLGALKLLAEQGIPVRNVVLIGSAINSDVERSGILELVNSGAVQKVTCFVSEKDRVVGWLEKIPFFYGSLGAKGFRKNGNPFETNRIRTIRFEKYGHSDYFESENIDNTFELIDRELDLELDLAA